MIRDTLLVIAVIVLSVAMFVIIVWHATLPQPEVRRIDCTWSEISPDFSPAMREACRKARNERSN